MWFAKAYLVFVVALVKEANSRSLGKGQLRTPRAQGRVNVCPLGYSAQSVFMQNCSGKELEIVADPKAVPNGCNVRRVSRCKPVGTKTSGYKFGFVKVCNRRPGPARCFVVLRRLFGRDVPAESSRSRGGTAGLISYGAVQDEDLRPTKVSTSVRPHAKGSCRNRVQFVKRCNPTNSPIVRPTCRIVDVPIPHCFGEDTDDNLALRDGIEDAKLAIRSEDDGLDVEGAYKAPKPFGCAQKQVCESVPKAGCEEKALAEGVSCSQINMEHCTFSPHRTNVEICHSVVDKYCRPEIPMQESQDCKYVQVSHCDTEHRLEAVEVIRNSCIRIPQVRCQALPQRQYGKKNSQTCRQVEEQVCKRFTVLEGVPKAQTNCRTETFSVCTDDSPLDMVSCAEVDRKLCGTVQAVELLTDECTVGLFPTCQFPGDNCKRTTERKCKTVEVCDGAAI